MEFAINYSLQSAALLAAGHIRIDRFKTPDWPDLIAQASFQAPVAVHFTLRAGSGNLKRTDWGLIEGLLEQTGTPYINLHLNPTVQDFPGFDIGTPEPTQFNQVVERLFEDVRVVTKRFGPERVIAENVPYRGAGGKILRPAVEPEVIYRILDETGCGLLLDISHARIAAHHLAIDEREYMAQLPVERLRELHFTGLHNLNGRLQDHLPILEADWPALEWVLGRIRSGEWARPWLLAFEYGGVGEKLEWRSDPAVIAEQVPLLYAMVTGI
ncbi:MAG TPA: DUF692 family protein [Anaerolineales bacterium]